jgi:hypothetical protein
MRELRYSLVAFVCLFLALYFFDWNVIKSRFFEDSQTGIIVAEVREVPEDKNSDVVPGSADDTVSPISSKFLFSSLPGLPHPTRDEEIDIRYQCAGPHYDDFITKLNVFCHEQVDQGIEPATWGNPEFAPLQANQAILFLGNSHTRQLALAFLAERYDDMVTYDTLPVSENRINTKRRFDFHRNVTIFTITNSAIVHSPVWYDLVEQAIGRPLASLDALVLGLFNSCNLDANTTFAKEMKEEAGISCMDREGPKFDDVAAQYSGPLAMTTMFSTHRAEYEHEAHAMVEALKVNRSNVAYIYSRKHVEALGVECGARKTLKTEDCGYEEKARKDEHRCVGEKGGHPDLVAWDVREWIRQQTEEGSVPSQFP